MTLKGILQKRVFLSCFSFSLDPSRVKWTQTSTASLRSFLSSLPFPFSSWLLRLFGEDFASSNAWHLLCSVLFSLLPVFFRYIRYIPRHGLILYLYTVPNMEPPFHLWFFIGSLESFDAWTFLLRCFPTSQVVFRPSLLSAVPTCFILFFPFCGFLFLHNILISLTPDIPSTVAQQGAFSGFLYSACFSHFSRAFASTYRLWHKPPPADSLAGQVLKL